MICSGRDRIETPLKLLSTRTKALLLGGFLVLTVGSGAISSEATLPTDASSCEALKGGSFAQLQDAPTSVTVSRLADTTDEVSGSCVVEGYVAPNIRFKLRLPGESEWNGRFVSLGPGGYGGEVDLRAVDCKGLVRRGYACITQDTGHTGTSSDATWAYNNLQAEFDYGIRAAHVSSLAGKAITERYYGRPQRFAYFVGCSGGGKQALVQAHRFPWDFDGMIALEPSNTTATGIVLLWNALATHDHHGNPIFTPAARDVLHEGVVEQCDANDGLVDGIIGGDPRTCEFDVAELQCKLGQTSGCLSQVQVDAAKKVYSGPVTSDGKQLYFPAMPGSEKGVYFSGGREGIDYKKVYWQYMGFLPDPGPSWEPAHFDFDADYKRTGMMDSILVASDNPDLRRLKDSGNKLMIIQGWEDAGLPGPLVTLDYYEMVERAMGGREITQQFVRLFMIPGRSHCHSGDGATSADYLSYMERWIEEGQAPDVIIGAHYEDAKYERGQTLEPPRDIDTAKFTRPHYPYPLHAEYKGTGNPNDYRNFRPVDPESR